jgi:non-ribosomal peptide synthase protein (TIGR01720 family)
VQQLVTHHDMLRMHIEIQEHSIQQQISAPGGPTPFAYVDLSGLPVEGQEAALNAALDEQRSALNLPGGAVFHLAYINCGAQAESYLYFVLHPLVADNFSWGILLDHFELAYQQLGSGVQIQLPDKTTSYQRWAGYLAGYADSGELQKEASYWQLQMTGNPALLPVARQIGKDANRSLESGSVTLTLDADRTLSLLTEVPRAYNSLITDVLISSLAETVTSMSGGSNLAVEIKGHGREMLFDHIDLSQTVGCFTAHYPVHLDIEAGSDPGETLMSIKEQLRRVPNGGIGYGVLRYLSEEAEFQQQFGDQKQPLISFHYLGNLDHVFSSTSTMKFEDPLDVAIRNADHAHENRLAVLAGIKNDRLFVGWAFRKDAYLEKTIEDLAASFMSSLERMITHCQSVEKARYTPSDFPEADLNQQELDALLAEISDLED